MIANDENNLKLLEECGRCQLDLKKVALLLEAPLTEVEQIMRNEESKLYQAYYKGRLLAEFEVRKSIYALAVQGSSQAQELWLRLRDELKVEEA